LKNVFDFKNWNSLNESENGKIPDSELVPIPVLKGKNYGHKLNPEAAKDYSDMVDAAKRDGVVWGITDSYRSYKVQDRIFDWDLFRRTGKKKKKGTGGKITVAYPGTSNHGWGSAVDLIVKKGDAAHNWLTKNASKFGFSPLSSEPWHWEHKGSAKKIKGGTKLDPNGSNYPPNGDSGYKYNPSEGLEDPGDGSKIYHEEDKDPYYYQIRDGVWWAIGPKIPEWSSLEKNKEANDILDARYPNARTRGEILSNVRKYQIEAPPTKSDPSKTRSSRIFGSVTPFRDFKNKLFTPEVGKNCVITIPGDPLTGSKKTGPVPVMVFYPGIKVDGKIGREYMPGLIKQAVPDWYDKYVIVIPNEHNTRWNVVRKEIEQALKESNLTQKNVSLGIFSGSGSKGTDISKSILSIPNLKNLILMDPTPGKDLIKSVRDLPGGVNVALEYNPKNWGAQKWYTDYIGELVSEASKRGGVYDTNGTSDHMSIPGDILIRNKKAIEESVR
jgi:hypothetical protein